MKVEVFLREEINNSIASIKYCRLSLDARNAN